MARNPLTAVPATRSSLPLLQIRRRLVVGVLALSVASGLISTVAWVASDHSAPVGVQLPDQSAVALAQTAVEDFLAARRSAVPAVSDVNNDFSTVEGTTDARQPLDATNLTFAGAAAASLGDGVSVTPLQTVQEKFTATISGRLYTITVPMVNAGKGKWLLGAEPAIAPVRSAPDQVKDGIDYHELYGSLNAIDGASLPEVYSNQIKEWAQAFAAAGHGDAGAAALRQLVDKEPGSHRTYSGLGGWTLAADPTIQSAVPVSTPYPGYIVRVGLVLEAPAANGSSSSSGPTLNADYDLYIKDDKSTTPPVVAWDAAGSYHSLMPYMNADQS